MENPLTINPKHEAEKIIQFLKKTFKEQKINKVVLGLSGGIDSTVVFYLLKKVLPEKNIFAVQLDYKPREKLKIDLKGINIFNVPIKKIVDKFQNEGLVLNFLAPVGTLPAGNGESQVAKNFNPSLSSNNETMKQWSNHIRNKVCLNLFFDEKNLKVPKFKQTEFVGHEVLQMKPIIVKDNVYGRFLEVNGWVFGLFPNAFPVIPAKAGIQTKNTWIPSYEGMTRLLKIWNLEFRISNKIEQVLKSFQLHLINRHRTTEIITSTQLWFHPDDFEKKIKL